MIRWGNVSAPVVVALVLVASVGTSAATTMLVRDPNPIVPVYGSLDGSADLTVDDQQLRYDGVNVTGVTVTVNNTGGSDLSGTLHAALRDANGTTLASKAGGTHSFPASTTETVNVTFGDEYSVADVARVEVTLEET